MGFVGDAHSIGSRCQSFASVSAACAAVLATSPRPILSLAIGTAVCVAAFSLVDVMVFEDVPGIRDRRNLIRINWTTQGGLFTTAELDTLQQLHPPALASLAAQGDRGLPVLLPSGSTTLAVALVSARFFETLGTRAVVGRLLTAADADPGAPPAAVVADDLWRGPFNGAADIVGRSIVVGGRTFTIVGVMPARAPGLRLVDLGTQDAMLPQVWVGLHHAAGWRAAAVTSPWLTVAARLAPACERAAGAEPGHRADGTAQRHRAGSCRHEPLTAIDRSSCSAAASTGATMPDRHC